MQITKTSFDINKHHIHIELIIENKKGIKYSVDAILDTGAPKTEFSDQFLIFTGFIDSIKEKVEIKSGLETQRYGKTTLHKINICGQTIDNFQIYVSQFEESWGIDALIGLDFFRQYNVEIDYSRGILTTKPLIK